MKISLRFALYISLFIALFQLSESRAASKSIVSKIEIHKLLFINSSEIRQDSGVIEDSALEHEKDYEDDNYYYGDLSGDTSYYPINADTLAINRRFASDSALSQFRDNSDFNYGKETDGISPLDILKRYIVDLLNKLFSKKGAIIAWDVAKYLLIAGAIIASFLLFSKTGLRSLFYRSTATAPFYDNIPENIHHIDFERLISEAVAGGDFARAVRLLYLQTLKYLTDADIIEWSPQKTNRDYQRDLYGAAPNTVERFVRLSQIFERVCYGKHKVDKNEYFRIFSEYEKFTILANSVKADNRSVAAFRKQDQIA